MTVKNLNLSETNTETPTRMTPMQRVINFRKEDINKMVTILNNVLSQTDSDYLMSELEGLKVELRSNITPTQLTDITSRLGHVYIRLLEKLKLNDTITALVTEDDLALIEQLKQQQAQMAKNMAVSKAWPGQRTAIEPFDTNEPVAKPVDESPVVILGTTHVSKPNGGRKKKRYTKKKKIKKIA